MADQSECPVCGVIQATHATCRSLRRAEAEVRALREALVVAEVERNRYFAQKQENGRSYAKERARRQALEPALKNLSDGVREFCESETDPYELIVEPNDVAMRVLASVALPPSILPSGEMWAPSCGCQPDSTMTLWKCWHLIPQDTP